jgi:hypothetical protein
MLGIKQILIVINNIARLMLSTLILTFQLKNKCRCEQNVHSDTRDSSNEQHFEQNEDLDEQEPVRVTESDANESKAVSSTENNPQSQNIQNWCDLYTFPSAPTLFPPITAAPEGRMFETRSRCEPIVMSKVFLLKALSC